MAWGLEPGRGAADPDSIMAAADALAADERLAALLGAPRRSTTGSAAGAGSGSPSIAPAATPTRSPTSSWPDTSSTHDATSSRPIVDELLRRPVPVLPDDARAPRRCPTASSSGAAARRAGRRSTRPRGVWLAQPAPRPAGRRWSSSTPPTSSATSRSRARRSRSRPTTDYAHIDSLSQIYEGRPYAYSTPGGRAALPGHDRARAHPHRSTSSPALDPGVEQGRRRRSPRRGPALGRAAAISAAGSMPQTPQAVGVPARPRARRSRPSPRGGTGPRDAVRERKAGGRPSELGQLLGAARAARTPRS